jgi:hypothetical protein
MGTVAMILRFLAILVGSDLQRTMGFLEMLWEDSQIPRMALGVQSDRG